MVNERDVDPAGLYEQERTALLASLATLPAERLAVSVPASPAWSVLDVLAHLIGITADLNAQRFPTGDAEAWTDEQVTTRRGRSFPALAEEWDREAPAFEDGLRLFGYLFGAHFLGDLLQHTIDIHHGAGDAWRPDPTTLAVALDHYLVTFGEALEAAGLGAVDVTVLDAAGPDGSAGESFRLGAGASVAAVRAGGLELFRAIGGRRTLTEIRALDWSGEGATVAAVTAVVSCYGHPAASLGEAAPTS